MPKTYLRDGKWTCAREWGRGVCGAKNDVLREACGKCGKGRPDLYSESAELPAMQLSEEDDVWSDSDFGEAAASPMYENESPTSPPPSA